MEHDVIRSPGTPPERASVAGTPDITELFRDRHVELVRLALFVVGDMGTAEDVVQDAFEQLHRRWHTLRRQSSALDYVRSVVLNRSRSVLRRRSVARKHEPTLATPSWSTDQHVPVLEQRSEFAVAFRELPRRQREVLALRFYLDLTVTHTARVLRISEGAVRSTSSRGLAALGRILGEQS